MSLTSRAAVLVGAATLALGLAPLPLTSSAQAADTTILNLTPPSVPAGVVVGTRVVADPGTWDPAEVALSYQWLRDGLPLAGRTAAGYQPRAADLGSALSVAVTASAEGADDVTVTSAPALVRRGTLVAEQRPAISGVRRFGRTLVADAGTWSRTPQRVRYQWLRSTEEGLREIRGATSRRLDLGLEEFGRRLAVRVTVRREGYLPAEATSVRTGAIGHRVPSRHVVTYHVETRGAISAKLATFRAQAQATFDDPRGWRASGITFRRVTKGGDFTLVLAQAATVPSFSSACSSEWSCRVGRYVIINQTRWQQASPMWNARKRSLRDYRHMVVNHETGHWLGHGHRYCTGSGNLAPVMQQQSKGLQGCRPNPWPTSAERRTPRFG